MGFAAVLSNDAFLVLSVAHVPHSSAAPQGSENKHPLQQTLSDGLATLWPEDQVLSGAGETEVCSMPQSAQDLFPSHVAPHRSPGLVENAGF